MCNRECIRFGESRLSAAEVAGRAVIEVGAMNVNGSLRAGLERLGPRSYLGVDIAPGPGVDEICDIAGLAARYGPESFDVVVSTELLEHVRDWRRGVSNLKAVLRPGGVLLLTTRSRRFAYHGHPFDFWRYEIADMRAIFADLRIEALEKDRSMPGVFLKARKPAGFREANLAAHELYSVITRRRCREIDDEAIRRFRPPRSWREVWAEWRSRAQKSV